MLFFKDCHKENDLLFHVWQFLGMILILPDIHEHFLSVFATAVCDADLFGGS